MENARIALEKDGRFRYELVDVEMLNDEFHSLRFTLNKYPCGPRGEKITDKLWSSVTHQIRSCEITDNGWIYEDGERFDEPLIKQSIQKAADKYWTKEVIDQVQLEIERQYVEKYMQFNAGDGAVSLDEINSILENMGLDDEITEDTSK